VYLFNQQQDPFQAELLDRDDDATKGLALVRLKTNSTVILGITALRLGYTSQLVGGENLSFIGFPDGVAFWTVRSGTFGRIDGRNLVFTGFVTGAVP
jgi:hypothetical protein